jgi:UDP-N-acetylglucosamine 3-dehydrogenase
LPDQLNVAVIGAGRMGAFHIRTYERVERARLAAVADPDEAVRARAIGQRAVKQYDDWRELLAQEAGSLDAVSIACPSKMHTEVALAALESGLHVLVEKPIATTVSDALRMRAAARAAGRKLMVGHVERFNPAVATLRTLLQEGRIGRVWRAHATRVGPLPARIRDAGVAIDLATHDLDVMQHVLGRQISEIYSDGGRFLHPSQEDLLTCLVRFGSGVDSTLGLLDVNWLTPEKNRELTIIGERGMLRASYVTQDVWFVESPTSLLTWEGLSMLRGDAEGAAMRYAVRKVEPLLAELQAFVDCIIEDTPEPVTAHDGLRALAAALAVRESAQVHRPVQLLDMPAPQQVLTELTAA